jgi:LmbE family N-acetylglucosaminyl deacetylase
MMRLVQTNKDFSKSILLLLAAMLFFGNTKSQAPKSYTSSEILLQLKKLNVLGSVLYIAAHPDDENTRLLAYLANEKLYRTGYLSLTRGDGGQNLIGDEQGVDLGLIRTQELLAARRVDGAEQFFSRAFDFGFSKSPEEALRIWDHDKILSDVVWVIRKFKPDVVIARFPTTGEGGHGHHTASAILAGEAFDAAADATKFTDQLKYVSVWQPKRLLWNTFNFGGNNTQREDQLKVECGDYNAMLGKSYGEIAAASRSQHRSQGFGVPAQRGSVVEYFKTLKGEAPKNDLMDGINLSWNRTANDHLPDIIAGSIKNDIEKIIANFSHEHPEKSVADLVKLYDAVDKTTDSYWKDKKLHEIKKIIENCSGLFMEAVAGTQYAVQGDSLKVTLTVNNRTGANILNADAQIDTTYVIFDQLKKNANAVKTYTWFILPDAKVTQPYWLENEMNHGSFNVTEQQLIGKGENNPLSVNFSMMIEGKEFVFTKPVQYKFTDPVKGEIYQPVTIIPAFSISSIPEISMTGGHNFWEVKSFKDNNRFQRFIFNSNGNNLGISGDTLLNKNQTARIENVFNWHPVPIFDSLRKVVEMNPSFEDIPYTKEGKPYVKVRSISYDHIPAITYLRSAKFVTKMPNIKTLGNLAGYIPGAGDKIPDALVQMGYKVVTLKETDITPANLKQFDVIITGVRAYNTNDWMNNVYSALMQYVKDGGVLFTQYNTNNFISNVKSKIGPFDFTISRNRITDEEAKVNFLLPKHPALNYPNKITDEDFKGWIQERSIYHAEKTDSNYKRILSMKDPGENENDGSLIIANYGKGRFVYTGLVFFRELPAGVPGAYRLFANLIANKKVKYVK